MIEAVRRKMQMEEDKDKGKSSFVYFIRSIRGKEYEQAELKKYFDKLVEKDDWKGNNYAALLDYVYLENRKEMKY